MYLLLSPAQKQIQYRLHMNMYLLLSPAQKQIQYRPKYEACIYSSHLHKNRFSID